jgi:hypothetical protein
MSLATWRLGGLLPQLPSPDNFPANFTPGISYVL